MIPPLPPGPPKGGLQTAKPRTSRKSILFLRSFLTRKTAKSMNEQTEAKPANFLQIGPDRVTTTPEEVVIEAKHPMPDWEVRELNPIPIYFEDKKFYLIEKRKAAPPFAVCYLLHPWPEGRSTNATFFWTYDLEAVQDREGARRSSNLGESARMGLLPLYPFLGLLWSGAQERLQRFGFVARNLTGASIFTVFCLAFAQGVFAVVMIQGSIRSGKIMIGGMIRALSSGSDLHLGPVAIPIVLLDVLLLVAFVADVMVRYSHYLREDQWTGGFLEWLVPKSLRKR